ncbi:unnamed protein product, partial [Tetraodon nigroviridis]
RMISPWDRWYSTSCCLCCHVRTGTIILGIWYMLINAVVLLILLSALNDPVQYRYHLTSSELGTDVDVMDDANICIATAISLLMILICGMATYGAYKQHAAWIIPFFCYQIFDFVLNTLVAISVVVYPNTVQDYLQQLVRTFSPPLFHSFNAESNPGFLSVPAWNVPLQRGHHVHQQHVPSFRSPHLHRMHPLLQSLPDRLRVELLPIRERPGFHRGAGVRHHQRHHAVWRSSPSVLAAWMAGTSRTQLLSCSGLYKSYSNAPGFCCHRTRRPSPPPPKSPLPGIWRRERPSWGSLRPAQPLSRSRNITVAPSPPPWSPPWVPGWVPGPGPGAVPPNTPSRLSLHFSTSTSTASNC